MVIPSGLFVQSAVYAMRDISTYITQDQEEELRNALNEKMCGILGIPFPPSKEVVIGYHLGLQVARTIYSGAPALVLHGVYPSDLL